MVISINPAKILSPMMPICRVRIRAGFWIYDFELGMVASYTASSFEVQKVEGSSQECNKKISLIIENDYLNYSHTCPPTFALFPKKEGLIAG